MWRISYKSSSVFNFYKKKSLFVQKPPFFSFGKILPRMISTANARNSTFKNNLQTIWDYFLFFLLYIYNKLFLLYFVLTPINYSNAGHFEGAWSLGNCTIGGLNLDLPLPVGYLTSLRISAINIPMRFLPWKTLLDLVFSYL